MAAGRTDLLARFFEGDQETQAAALRTALVGARFVRRDARGMVIADNTLTVVVRRILGGGEDDGRGGILGGLGR